MSGLERFVAAQDASGTYERALTELHGGRKQTHWMWFVFPQLAGLGHSWMAQEYALASLEEARAYLAHPLLGARLREATAALGALGALSARDVLGEVDALKLRSSLTLFDAVAPDEPTFSAVLEQWYDGEPDQRTLALLGGTSSA